MRKPVSTILAMVIFCAFTVCCRPASNVGSRPPNEQDVKNIFQQISDLQDEEESIASEMLGRPRIFAEENVRDFPGNRPLLENTAKQQILSLQRIIELEKLQVERLDEILALPVDERFRRSTTLLAQQFKKGLESKQLDIQSYNLVLDPAITTSQMLQERNQTIVDRRNKIDAEKSALEKQRKDIQPTE
jgi:hypothetical protein